MKSKTWLRLFYAAAIGGVLTIGTFAQTRTNQIYRPCAASIIPASVRFTLAGAITLTPCSGQTVTVNGTLNIPDGQAFTIGASNIAVYSSGINTTTFGGSAFINNFRSSGALNLQIGTTSLAGLNGTTSTFFTNVGTAVASAAAIVPTGNVFHVSGVAAITSITSTNITAGTCITMICDSTATLTDGSNIKAAGNLVATADDTWSGCYDGTSWYETARAIN